MPEIIEVCWLSNYLNKFVGYTIETITSLSVKYNNDHFQIIKSLIIDSVDTHGKMLWFNFKDSNIKLVFNFGLHGIFTHIKSSSSKLEIKVSNDTESKLIYFDLRIGGSVAIITCDMLNEKLNSLGDDLLKTKIDPTIILNRLNTITKNGTKLKNKNIASLLLEQNKDSGIGSGIGNYLMCEILYEAKISPHTTISTLLSNNIYIIRLSNAIVKILKWAYMTNTEKYFKKMHPEIFEYISKMRKSMPLEYTYYPEIDIGMFNSEFSCRVYKKDKDPRGNIVKGERLVNGRICYWVSFNIL